MRYALISDIHANLPALGAVLADIAATGTDATYHLGDLVGYAPWPNEVVERLTTERIAGVAGNYDSTVATNYKHCGCRYEDAQQEALSHLSYEWTREHVTAETKRRLGALPFRIDLRPAGGHLAGPTLTLVHGNQALNTVYVTEDRSDDFLTKMGGGDRRAGRRRRCVWSHAQAMASCRRRRAFCEHGECRSTEGRRLACGICPAFVRRSECRGRVSSCRLRHSSRDERNSREHAPPRIRLVSPVRRSFAGSGLTREHRMSSLFRRCLAELLGTFALVAIGPGAVMVAARTHGFGDAGIALAFGLAVTIIVASSGHLSGAHVNPAVTIGFWSIGRFRTSDVLPYVIAQCLGAIAASLLCGWLLGPVGNYGATLPALAIPQSFVVELGYTGLLGFVIMGVATDARTPTAVAPFAIGATVFAGALVTGPLTGGSFNPARSLGPAVASGNWTAHLLYWVAPIAGMMLAMRTYEFLRPASATEAEPTHAPFGVEGPI